jgi:hypothetical protein
MARWRSSEQQIQTLSGRELTVPLGVMSGVDALVVGLKRGAAMAVLAALLAMGEAGADVMAGRDAFLQGKFALAEAEWRRDAAQGNAEAEFGLGELSEQIKGDYPEAERWYGKAAERGNIHARYRLALIAIAGNTEIAPDPVKAYKWAILASDPSDPWGQLARHLASELEDVLTTAEQAEGKRLAELWQQKPLARTTKPAPKVTTEPVASMASPPPASLQDAKPDYCPPGFPECAVAPKADEPQPLPPVAFVPSEKGRSPYPDSERALTEAINRTSCGWLRKTTADNKRFLISGTVASDNELQNLLRIASTFAIEDRPEIQVRVVPPPLCQSLLILARLQAASLATENLYVRLLSESALTLSEGDPINIEIKAGNYGVNLRIDYFSLDGRVLHMLPSDKNSRVRLAAGTTQIFGPGGSGESWRAGGPPFGTEVILVLATPQSLDLGARPLIESAETYLSSLEKALRKSAATERQPNLFGTILVQTQAK